MTERRKKTKDWTRLGDREIRKITQRVQSYPKFDKITQNKWQVEVHFIGSKKMAHLNYQYRGQKRATDILSFSSPSPFFESGYLGELLICTDRVKSQAREHRHSMKSELRILLVHGLLHLLGYEHEKKKSDARKMTYWENRILRDMGISDSAGLIARAH